MLLVGFKSTYQKRFNQKNYLGKNLAVTVVYFCYGHTSLKREESFTEQSLSLNPKKNLLDTLHGKAFKARQWLKIQFFTI